MGKNVKITMATDIHALLYIHFIIYSTLDFNVGPTILQSYIKLFKGSDHNFTVIQPKFLRIAPTLTTSSMLNEKT